MCVTSGRCRGFARQGFALIATVLLMVLLTMLALAFLTLNTIELRNSMGDRHQAVARANAKLALMHAVGELQKYLGPDQRVTARAVICEGHDKQLANRNWLGVWKTTCSYGNGEWPVVGKAPRHETNDTPYSRPGAYEDLRHTRAALAEGVWKNELRLAWLVSSKTPKVDVGKALDPNADDCVELVGRGSLGRELSAADYQANRVLVEKIAVANSGAFAWYTSGNNQKASLDPMGDVSDAEISFAAAPRFNPDLVEINGEARLRGLQDSIRQHPDKLVSYANAALIPGKDMSIRDVLDESIHHMTAYSPGLFVDTLLGGLRRDLTPLLLARQGEKVIDFFMQQGGDTRTFSSRWPIVPGPGHGVLGPSFGALRNWARHTNSELHDAETSFSTAAIRMRPTTYWPHDISDGACADASKWAESAPKIHPIMTDCRWHYYFSHHNNRIRTHIIPRVCLWNPYNRALKSPELSVLMPNPFYGLAHGMHFFPEESHVSELKQKHSHDPSHVFSKWIKKSGYVGGDVYKIRTNPFPAERYLAFSLETTTLDAGECQVFSPRVTSPSLSASGVNLQAYYPLVASSNVLSPKSPQGVDHFYFDHHPSVRYQVQATTWKSLSETDLNEIDFGRIFDYQAEVSLQGVGKVESFPFALKKGWAPNISDLYTRVEHPTLQLINNGAGGVAATSYFAYIGKSWGSANQQDKSFGYLQAFSDAPLKDAPDTHQVGAKMLWLDESGTEANAPPLRVDRWTTDHMIFNVAPIANWNVRAQLVSRSPSAQCAMKWYMTSTGPWLLQFVPYSPQDVNDQPSVGSNGTLVKNPFGAVTTFPFARNVVLFDLPSKNFGVMSLAKLRHAMLCPYSWVPSYIIMHSLRDMHAPSDYSAHEIAVSDYSASYPMNRWDYLIGGARDSGLNHGPYAREIDSSGLLQIGSEHVLRDVDGVTMSSEDEVLAYDVAYEVNHNLLDRYFLSSIPISIEAGMFCWSSEEGRHLWNPRYQFNPDSGFDRAKAEELFAGANGLDIAFWRSAELLKNRAAFNVNSTSVQAWTAFLSACLGEKRPLQEGDLEDGVVSFARYSKPKQAVKTNDADLDGGGAWEGARKLSNDEVRILAKNIVQEVQSRGPFISLADFINRRLCNANDETSHMGTLDAAIKKSGLNAKFEDNRYYQTTSVNVGERDDAPDNNLGVFKAGYRYRGSNGLNTTVQPTSRAWGLPGFLTQGDILEPLMPAMAARGDVFTIRAYGESRAKGEIMARAWLEVVVERTPHYMESRSFAIAGTRGNFPADNPLILDHARGSYREGTLTEINKRFGRRFVIKSFRWLNAGEI